MESYKIIGLIIDEKKILMLPHQDFNMVLLEKY